MATRLTELASIAAVFPVPEVGETARWYRDNLGLEVTGGSAPDRQSGAPFGFAGDCAWEAAFMTLPDQPGVFTVDLVEWKDPEPVGRPYATANQLGIYRMALIVDDIHTSYETLVANGDNQRAELMLARARADAELALMLARSHNEEVEAQGAEAEVADKRRKLGK